MYGEFAKVRDMYLLLFFLSFSLMAALPSGTPTFEELDLEMRGYVKYASTFLGWKPDAFVSHVSHTNSLGNNTFFSNGYSRFYVIVFDQRFVEKNTPGVRKGIAGHEVGHAYPPCEELYNLWTHGLVSYVASENCADVVAATVFGYQNALALLQAIRRENPTSESIQHRIDLLKKQRLGAEKDLTPHP